MLHTCGCFIIKKAAACRPSGTLGVLGAPSHLGTLASVPTALCISSAPRSRISWPSAAAAVNWPVSGWSFGSAGGAKAGQSGQSGIANLAKARLERKVS